jgi:DNA-directed RNA polymerase specialized sigma24 family protein
MAEEERVPPPPEMEAIGLAMLALLVDQRQTRVAAEPGAVATEVLLAEAGLTSTQIAGLLRTSSGAVRMKLSRNRAKQRGSAKKGKGA